MLRQHFAVLWPLCLFDLGFQKALSLFLPPLLSLSLAPTFSKSSSPHPPLLPPPPLMCTVIGPTHELTTQVFYNLECSDMDFGNSRFSI